MNLITPDSGLVVWMTIIFAIVFFILAKFGFPVITSMVKKRNDKIHDSLAAARLAEEKLATLAQQQQELLEKARVEQAALLKDAAAARDNLIAQAKQQAKSATQPRCGTSQGRLIRRAKATARDRNMSARRFIFTNLRIFS